MDSTKRRLSQPLQLEGVPLDTILAKKLPPRLAFSYHVLPLAIERNQITVAMADPENKFAIEAVRSALGANPYIVKSDQTWIDRLLRELWPDYQNDDLHLLLYSRNNDISKICRDYSNYIRNQLKIPDSNIYSLVGAKGTLSDVVEESNGVVDLVIIEETIKSKYTRSMLSPRYHRVIQKLQPSVLVARQPRWPIEKILLILRCENRDHIAVDWVVKMGLPSKAVVTMSVPLPPIPRMYQGLSGMSVQIPKMLKGNSALEKHLQSLTARLASHGIEVKLNILEGDTKRIIQQEVMEGEYDLVSVAAKPESWLKRTLLSSVVNPVLEYARIPIFIAKPPNG
ncbi:MAG: hypothetical protein A2Z14_01725 [Chloroflexi bacterium RBG_16_48_8]|nr:MAG: hypothetical protein A2Z14_01725 [Chloroflexi bacterium RBG_16_48_8]